MKKIKNGKDWAGNIESLDKYFLLMSGKENKMSD